MEADVSTELAGPVRVSADRSRCIGAGLCVLSAPEVFDQDDDEGLVAVLDAQPAGDHRDAVETARELCPAKAINVQPAPVAPR